jgi:hypothetical protein
VVILVLNGDINFFVLIELATGDFENRNHCCFDEFCIAHKIESFEDVVNLLQNFEVVIVVTVVGDHHNIDIGFFEAQLRCKTSINL